MKILPSKGGWDFFGPFNGPER